MTFAKLLRTPILKNICERLLLKWASFKLLKRKCAMLTSSIAKGDLVYFPKRVPDTSKTSATRVLHERQSATGVKNFDFDKDTSQNIISHLYISYIANEELHLGQSSKFGLLQQLFAFKEFCVKTRLSNIFKTINVTTLTKAILKSSYIVLHITSK